VLAEIHELLLAHRNEESHKRITQRNLSANTILS